TECVSVLNLTNVSTIPGGIFALRAHCGRGRPRSQHGVQHSSAASSLPTHLKQLTSQSPRRYVCATSVSNRQEASKCFQPSAAHFDQYWACCWFWEFLASSLCALRKKGCVRCLTWTGTRSSRSRNCWTW